MTAKAGPRARVHFSIVLYGVIAFLVACSSTPGTYTPALGALRARFQEARVLPPGSRPQPPDDDIGALVGTSLAIVRTAIGHPEPPGDSSECDSPTCTVFVYGPPAGEPKPVSCDAQLCTVEVVTGGPFILIIGARGGRVTSARWQGQK